jgi:3-carboxymethyl-3-hydroxy-acyl-[acp] dehydratase
MKFQTILAETNDRSVSITLNRPQAKNSLNRMILDDLSEAFRQSEVMRDCQTIILKGSREFFCTGMDFREALPRLNGQPAPAADEELNRLYMDLLGKISNSSCIVISIVEGTAMAGGIGLVAASDLVIASESARFSLSEALWGLLPAMVLPYLIRRVGFQAAYKMTLTTETISAESAARMNLVDELTDNTERKLRQLQTRLNILNKETIRDLKHYFKRHLHPITAQQENAAVAETTRLAGSERVQTGIRNYLEHQIFPWEKQ